MSGQYFSLSSALKCIFAECYEFVYGLFLQNRSDALHINYILVYSFILQWIFSSMHILKGVFCNLK